MQQHIFCGYQEKTVVAADGCKLYSFCVTPSRALPRAPALLWLHGFGQQAHRFDEAIQFMAERGFTSVACDLRGYGRSGGPRGHLHKESDMLKDLERIAAAYAPEIGNKLIVIGFSMGGLVAIRCAQCAVKLPMVAGIALSPCLRPHPAILSDIESFLVAAVAQVMPMMEVKPHDMNVLFTHDPQMRFEEYTDPLRIYSATASGLQVALKACQDARAQAHKVAVPLHILMAGQDHIVDGAATKKFYYDLPKKLGHSFVEYEDMYHAILHETHRLEVLQEIEMLCRNYCD